MRRFAPAMPGMVRYFVEGFGFLGAWVGVLWLSKQVAKVSRRTAYAMDACALGVPISILAGAMTSMVFGGNGGYFSVFVACFVFVVACIRGIYVAIRGEEKDLEL